MVAKSKHKRHSAIAWLLVHIVFPLLPFLIEGGSRCLILGWRLDTFSGATLSASMALICFFIHQSLIAHHYPIQNDTEEEQRVAGVATWFLIFAVASTVLFTAIVLLSAVVEAYHVAQTSLFILQITTFTLLLIPVFAYQTQKSFKLCATF